MNTLYLFERSFSSSAAALTRLPGIANASFRLLGMPALFLDSVFLDRRALPAFPSVPSPFRLHEDKVLHGWWLCLTAFCRLRKCFVAALLFINEGTSTHASQDCEYMAGLCLWLVEYKHFGLCFASNLWKNMVMLWLGFVGLWLVFSTLGCAGHKKRLEDFTMLRRECVKSICVFFTFFF